MSDAMKGEPVAPSVILPPEFVEECSTCDEKRLYQLIDELGGRLYYMRGGMPSGMSFEDMVQAGRALELYQAEVEHAVDQTSVLVSNPREMMKEELPQIIGLGLKDVQQNMENNISYRNATTLAITFLRLL